MPHLKPQLGGVMAVADLWLEATTPWEIEEK